MPPTSVAPDPGLCPARQRVRRQLAAIAAQFHDVPHLFLYRLVQQGDGALWVIVDEASDAAKPRLAARGAPRLDAALARGRPIRKPPARRRFTLHFEDTIAVVSRDEGRTRFEDTAAGPAVFCVLPRSPFRDFVAQSMFAELADGPFEHVALRTGDQAIDIACRSAPQLSVVALPDPAPEAAPDPQVRADL